MKRIFLALCTVSLALATGTGPGAQERPAATVVASTPWTAAFALAAGVKDVHVIAPYEMQHPPEYELRPADVRVFASARVFVYAGYENMMKSLAANTAAGDIAMVKIQTDYDPESMNTSIRAIAAAAGTGAQAESNIAALAKTFAACRAEVKTAGGAARNAVVHSFQKRLAEGLGLTVVGTFGPAPLEARSIVDLSRSGADLVIDNWHNPVGSPLRETLSDARFAEFINFPGKDGTRTLGDVLRHNTRRLIEALK